MSENSQQAAMIADVRRAFAESEHRIVKVMHEVQSELLRAFEAASHPQNLRIRKVEADQSNLDSSLSGRIEILENRLHQIEMKLGKAN